MCSAVMCENLSTIFSANIYTPKQLHENIKSANSLSKEFHNKCWKARVEIPWNFLFKFFGPTLTRFQNTFNVCHNSEHTYFKRTLKHCNGGTKSALLYY